MTGQEHSGNAIVVLVPETKSGDAMFRRVLADLPADERLLTIEDCPAIIFPGCASVGQRSREECS